MVPRSLELYPTLESLLLLYEVTPEQLTLEEHVSLEPFLSCFAVIFILNGWIGAIHDQYLSLKTFTIQTSSLSPSVNQMPFTLSCSLHVRKTFPATSLIMCMKTFNSS